MVAKPTPDGERLDLSSLSDGELKSELDKSRDEYCGAREVRDKLMELVKLKIAATLIRDFSGLLTDEKINEALEKRGLSELLKETRAILYNSGEIDDEYYNDLDRHIEGRQLLIELFGIGVNKDFVGQENVVYVPALDGEIKKAKERVENEFKEEMNLSIKKNEEKYDTYSRLDRENRRRKIIKTIPILIEKWVNAVRKGEIDTDNLRVPKGERYHSPQHIMAIPPSGQELIDVRTLFSESGRVFIESKTLSEAGLQEQDTQLIRQDELRKLIEKKLKILRFNKDELLKCLKEHVPHYKSLSKVELEELTFGGVRESKGKLKRAFEWIRNLLNREF